MSGTTVVAPERPGKPPAGPSAQARFRPELQGVRALASVLVVVYHVWFDRISGGVDVFFLVSGFLITGQLYRALLRGRIELRATWGRMIKRLFPAAMTVLLTVVVLSQLLLPQDRWFQTIREVVASALFYENWQLAADSVDYFAQHNSASLVQHFWSLSIQGQFYLLWPLLFVGLGLLVRRLGWSLRRTVNLLLIVLFAASLAYSVYLTAADQPLAYFHGLTRVWEFALGGLMAMFLDQVTLPRLLRIVLGWIGVAGLVLCGVLLEVDSVFPGWIALWPTLSAGLVLVAGQTESVLGADRWLSSKFLGYVGNLSFSLYLWHWPVLVFYLIVRDRVAVGLLGGTFVVGVSFLLSILTYHLIENPIRLSKIGTAKQWGAYRFGVLALAPVLVASGVWQGVSSARANYEIAIGDPDHPGAVAHAPGFVYRGASSPSIVPPTVKLADDWARTPPDQCSISPRNKELQICTESPEGPCGEAGGARRGFAHPAVPRVVPARGDLRRLAGLDHVEGCVPVLVRFRADAGRPALPRLEQGGHRRTARHAPGRGDHARHHQRQAGAERDDAEGLRRRLGHAGQSGHPGRGRARQPALHVQHGQLRRAEEPGRPVVLGAAVRRGGRDAVVGAGRRRPGQRDFPGLHRLLLRPEALPRGGRERAGLHGRQPPVRDLQHDTRADRGQTAQTSPAVVTAREAGTDEFGD